MKRIVVCALIAFGVASAKAADDWPQFRGPTGQGLSSAVNVPVEWNDTKNVDWKVALPGRGWSSPVLSGGRLYVTTAIKTDDKDAQAENAKSDTGGVSLRAISLDAATGKTLWDVEVIRASLADAEKVHSKNGLASPTPVVADGRLYVHFGHMGTAALDFAGRVLWRQTSITYSPVHGNGGSPVVIDDLIVFNCDGSQDPYVIALDRRTGEVRWKTERRTPAKSTFSFSTPLVVGWQASRQIISPASGLVAGYDPQMGRELWRVTYGDGYSVIPRPVVSEGILVVSSGFNRPTLYGIRLPDPGNPDDNGDLTESHIVWRENRGAPNTPSPVALAGNLYTVSDSGVAACIDIAGGKPHWTHRLGGAFSASPIAAEDRIYFLNEAGACFVVKADAEYTLLATNDLGERTFASPVFADNCLFLRSELHLWRISGEPVR
jgi:outer membrane protein assembly factor BamB